ncbi:3-oxoacyl-[acyl-carrier-protein] synthase-3 [Lipingzhangella halophila]|uniref:3-oxoacyl-[acyl-carrier-protein] synthase-3 n=1 Tax=Lipingzhangella halophila TaxID=1783352 RepID=A0A7W7RH45_9ACTN|nr:ketoacyl-ACP synthase III family protein [Lipingzhangella halophila]MBB4931896.1 3-oxoacyl-[acyl-carrier-protein] synthase-3 [Lipingzhangella halophila]
MRVDAALSITAASVWLPPDRYHLDQALAAGVLSERHARHAAGPVAAYAGATRVDEMAVHAAQDTLKMGDATPDDVALFHYAWAYEQGEHLWSPAPQIARSIGITGCDSVGFHQMSNGGATALYTAASTMLLEPRIEQALVSTADNFSTLPYDRWANSMVTILSDGATAALLTRGPGPLPVIAIASTGDPLIGGGLVSEGTVWQPVRHGRVLSREEWRTAARSATALRETVSSSLTMALDDAGLTPGDPRIRAVLTPRMSAELATRALSDALPDPLYQRHILLGQDTGHIGAGDMLANLAWLLERPTGPEPGGYTVLLSFGFGGSATCLVVANGAG